MDRQTPFLTLAATLLLTTLACDKPEPADGSTAAVTSETNDAPAAEEPAKAAEAAGFETRKITNFKGVKWLSLCQHSPNLTGQNVPERDKACALQGDGVMPDEFKVPADARPVVEPIEPVTPEMVAWLNSNNVVLVHGCNETLPDGLELVSCSDMPTAEALKPAANLRFFRASMSEVSEPFYAALGGLSKLTHLTLEAPVDDKGLAAIGKLTSLESLTLTSTANTFTDAGVQYLRDLGQLEQLSLAGGKRTRHSMESIASIDGLEYLSLRSIRGHDGKADNLEPLTGLTKLQRLDISLKDVADASFLSKLSGLRIARLYDAKNLAKLAVPPNLRWLDLYDVPTETLKAMPPAPSVKELSYRTATSGSEAIIEAAVEKTPNLETFWLSGDIEPAAVGKLTKASNLRQLCLCDSNATYSDVDPSAMKAIQEMQTEKILKASAVIEEIAKLSDLEAVSLCGKDDKYKEQLAKARPKLELGTAWGINTEIVALERLKR